MCYDHGGERVLKVSVKDGVAAGMETDDGDEFHLQGCACGMGPPQASKFG